MSRSGGSWRSACGVVGLGLVAITCNGAGGGSRAPQVADASYPDFDGTAAYELVKRQVEFGPRVPGTEPHAEMGRWLEAYLRARADTLDVQSFEHVTVDGEVLPLRNFWARFRVPGTRPILLLAHWDTRPVSDAAVSAEERARPVPGANDGASGTAVLLHLAELMDSVPPTRSVDLLLVDGEDYGDFGEGKDVFLGSRYFANHLPESYDPEFGILLDMIGDRDLEIYVEGNSNRLAPGVVDRVWDVARRLGFGDLFHRDVRHTVNDDHIPLNEAGIPTINVIDFDYPYWHTPEDTPDKVAASSLEAVGEVMAWLIYRGDG